MKHDSWLGYVLCIYAKNMISRLGFIFLWLDWWWVNMHANIVFSFHSNAHFSFIYSNTYRLIKDQLPVVYNRIYMGWMSSLTFFISFRRSSLLFSMCYKYHEQLYYEEIEIRRTTYNLSHVIHHIVQSIKRKWKRKPIMKLWGHAHLIYDENTLQNNILQT